VRRAYAQEIAASDAGTVELGVVGNAVAHDVPGGGGQVVVVAVLSDGASL
jgi:hypothetical protein